MDSSQFSIRNFLREHEALLVHFNTPMSVRHPSCFPNDLRDAKSIRDVPLSFSTIQANDRGPAQGGLPADANAAGSVGLVVDISDQGSVLSVDSSDSGSIPQLGSLGLAPTPESCERSIRERTSINEWWVQNFYTLGIFVFLPADVFVKWDGGQGERPANLQEVLREFPHDRILSASNGKFAEYDRATETWNAVSYADIVPNSEFDLSSDRSGCLSLGSYLKKLPM